MLLTTLVLAASLVGADGPVSAPFEPACAHAKTAAVLLGGPPELLQAGDTDVLHYDLDIEIDPGAESIGGSNTMTVRSVVDGLSVFPFRLDDVFTIGTLTVDGTAAAWQRIDGATVEVTLGHPYDADQTFELRVEYAGVPDGGGFGSIRFRTRSGAPEVWTLSEPWFAHTWWPAKDDSTDKTTADLWFTVPGNMVVASNGVLQGVDDVGGGQLRYRWRTDYPTADYLYCIGATNYETFGGTWTYGSASMPLDFYIYPEDDTQGNRDAWMENLDILDVFSDAYGIYPFADEKYGMCQVGFGGGMEHQTMTSQGGFWESTTAHEAAHQWWGDMVTCATWHDIWLNEGFATFSEAIWYGNKPGSPGMSAYHDRMDARRPSAVNDSVYVYDISSVNRIFSSNFTYRKGAWVLHMLRHVLGDETFFDVLADYRAAFEYGSATTEDLRAVAEATAGRELAWFFDEWVYDIGAPEYRWAWQSHEVRGRSFVEVYVEQVQPASYPIFAMPVDVVTVGPGGGETHAVWNDADAEHLLFETAGAVSAATLDPEDWILHDPIAPAAFVEGPPKVVDTSPAPGSIVAAGAATTVEILLHKTVVVEAANVTLAGETTGMVPFVFGYDAPAITLDFDAPLPADEYVLTVDDAVVDGAAGLALDGEVIDGALPSGDGLPGGAAIVRFTVEAAPGDVDGDGVIGFGDLLVVLSTWGPCPPPPCAGDANGDGTVDFADVLLVLSNWS